MKTFLFIILTAILSVSCMSARKFTTFIEPEVQNITATTTNGITFDLTALENKDIPAISTKEKSQFIPAIFYWQWNNTIRCDINPMQLGQLFQESFLQYADSLNVAEKLQNKNLEIKIEKIPNSFSYTHKGNLVFLIIGYVMSDLEAIIPQEQNLQVNYKVTENGATLKEGMFMIANPNLSARNIWKSTKKFTLMYMDLFNKNTQSMAKELATQISTDLKEVVL